MELPFIQPSQAMLERGVCELVHSVFHLAKCFWRRFYKIYQCIFSIMLLLAFLYEILRHPLAWTLISFTQVCFLPKLFEIDPMILKKQMKMWKVCNNRLIFFGGGGSVGQKSSSWVTWILFLLGIWVRMGFISTTCLTYIRWPIGWFFLWDC